MEKFDVAEGYRMAAALYTFYKTSRRVCIQDNLFLLLLENIT